MQFLDQWKFSPRMHQREALIRTSHPSFSRKSFPNKSTNSSVQRRQNTLSSRTPKILKGCKKLQDLNDLFLKPITSLKLVISLSLQPESGSYHLARHIHQVQERV